MADRSKQHRFGALVALRSRRWRVVAIGAVAAAIAGATMAASDGLVTTTVRRTGSPHSAVLPARSRIANSADRTPNLQPRA
jgi:hypothetical protein